MARLNVIIEDEELYQALKLAATLENRTLSDIVRDLTVGWAREAHPEAVRLMDEKKGRG